MFRPYAAVMTRGCHRVIADKQTNELMTKKKNKLMANEEDRK